MDEIKMLRNNLLVRVSKQVKTDAGVYLAPEQVIESAKSATYGEVVSVGPKVESVKKGNYVLYKSYVGNELKHRLLDDENSIYIVVSEDDVLAVCPPEKLPN